MTALRFQTGGRHQTSPASLRGEKYKNTIKEEQMLRGLAFTMGKYESPPHLVVFVCVCVCTVYLSAMTRQHSCFQRYMTWLSSVITEEVVLSMPCQIRDRSRKLKMQWNLAGVGNILIWKGQEYSDVNTTIMQNWTCSRQYQCHGLCSSPVNNQFAMQPESLINTYTFT